MLLYITLINRFIMELTINQIKEKQKKLQEELEDKLNQFKKETGLKVNGDIKCGFIDHKEQHFVILNYSNPFNVFKCGK